MNRTLKLLICVLAVGAGLAGAAFGASSPSVKTGGASSVNDTSAVLHGTINPNGTATSYRFEWGLTNTYGLSSAVRSAGSGTKTRPVQVSARQLIPGTVYHFRLDALNRLGGTVGTDHTFTTTGHPPPGAFTGPASQLGRNSATVTGVVNPNGATTTWWVQYGLSPLYGLRTEARALPAARVPLLVATQIPGLQPGVVFHYRIVAAHGSAVLRAGADQTFVTYPSRRPRPRVPAKTTPRRDSSPPYTFTSSGRVTRSSSLPQSVQCTGSASVRFFDGKRRVGSNLFPVGPDCRFSGKTTFRHLPGRGPASRRVHLKVLIHFQGNHYLAPADARSAFVTLG